MALAKGGTLVRLVVYSNERTRGDLGDEVAGASFVLVMCWLHARCKFTEVDKEFP